MPKSINEKQNLESLIAEIKELLNELKNEQNNMAIKLEKHHGVTMQKLEKLREFDEIADMTNQVFERRISNIEYMLKSEIAINKKNK